MNISLRGLQAFRSRLASRRQQSDLVTQAHIKEQSRLSLGSYGRPRMTEELKEIGLNVDHRCVGRLMRQNGILVVRTRKHKATTDSNHKFNIAPNLLDRNFTADGPNQKWACDITYIWTRKGWLYLAVILDLHSRRVIGWAVSNRMKRDLAIRALKMAIVFRAPPKGCIHHTDRGSQYCSHDYQKILRQHGFKVSMSGKGNCYDNATVETFFKTIKAKLIWRHTWETRRSAEMAIFDYINSFYNPRQRSIRLRCLTGKTAPWNRCIRLFSSMRSGSKSAMREVGKLKTKRFTWPWALPQRANVRF
jgi:transposase InsO family protein